MNRITVHLDARGNVINPNIYGHFAEHLGACIYEGIWVGRDFSIPNTNGIRNDVVKAMKKIMPPVICWPGGCFADDYHWRDGIGTQESRPQRINIWWGDDIEFNQFGTHEFIEFCRLVGAEPYIVGNVGSGTPDELRNWVEYCNFAGDSSLARERGVNGSAQAFKVKYWGVGNENWGCGGNFDPEGYCAEYRRFATYLRDFSDTPLYLIACGPSADDYNWTRSFFANLHNRTRVHGFAAHYYARDWQPLPGQSPHDTTGQATNFSERQWYGQLYLGLKIEDLVTQHRAAMDSFDPERKVDLIVDEWGTWHPPAEGHHPRHLWQQNTIRDALVAAMTLDIFNRHADKVVMGNIAQTINVLQSMILTDGAKMLTTPTYHVYDMYQAHKSGQSLLSNFESDAIDFQYKNSPQSIPALSGSASLKDGVVTISVVNALLDTALEAEVRVIGADGKEVAVMTLAHEDVRAHNSFDAPDTVTPVSKVLDASGSSWKQSFDAASVNVIKVRL